MFVVNRRKVHKKLGSRGKFTRNQEQLSKRYNSEWCLVKGVSC